MAADVGGFVRAQHHRHGVPTYERANFVFNRLIARQRWLLIHADGVDVRRFGMECVQNAVGTGMRDLLVNQIRGAFGAVVVDDIVQRFNPLLRFLRIGIEKVLLTSACSAVM